MMNSGVYQITNTVNYHIYIGSTSNFDVRFEKHKKSLRKGVHSNIHLQRAWNKDGEDSFEFSVVEYIDEDWVAREQYYTDLWNPEYAIQKECVTSRLGCKHSIGTKQKMSDWRKLNGAGENNGMYGKHHSSDAKQKISNAISGENNGLYGKYHSEETKRQISETSKKRKPSEETKQKMSIAKTGQNNPNSRENRLKRLQLKGTV